MNIPSIDILSKLCARDTVNITNIFQIDENYKWPEQTGGILDRLDKKEYTKTRSLLFEGTIETTATDQPNIQNAKYKIIFSVAIVTTTSINNSTIGNVTLKKGDIGLAPVFVVANGPISKEQVFHGSCYFLKPFFKSSPRLIKIQKTCKNKNCGLNLVQNDKENWCEKCYGKYDIMQNLKNLMYDSVELHDLSQENILHIEQIY